ncbi:MAG: hypothetical protein IPG61_17595 [bacterium]|nr:hypothetical protein [bacterium]
MEKEQYHACAPVLNRFMEPLWQHGRAHGSPGWRGSSATGTWRRHSSPDPRTVKLLLVMARRCLLGRKIDGGLTDQDTRDPGGPRPVRIRIGLSRGLPEEYGRIIRDHRRDT